MTISNTSRTAGPFIGNGITKNFPFSYKVFSRDDVLVAVTVTATNVETILALDADYTVTLNADQNTNPGGVIALANALPVGKTLAATSNIALVQALDLTNQGGFYPKVINDALDRIVITIQQLSGKIGNGLGIGMAAITEQALAALALVQQISTATGASLIGFIQGAAGTKQRTVLDRLREIISMKDFGAKGDSVADDSAGLTLSQASGAAEIEIPAGTYLAKSFPARANCVYRGIGNPTLSFFDNANPVKSALQSNSRLEGINLSSTLASLEWQRIAIEDVNGVTMRDCGVYGFRHAVALPNAWGLLIQRSSNVVIDNCRFGNNSQADIALTDTVRDVLILNAQNDTDGGVTLNVEPNSTDGVNGMNVVGGRFKLVYLLENDVKAYASKNIVFTGARIDWLVYDGSGASFIGCDIGGIGVQPDGNNSVYAGSLMIDNCELGPNLIKDPYFFDISTGDVNGCWNISTGGVAPFYARQSDAAAGKYLIVNPNKGTSWYYLVLRQAFQVYPAEPMMVFLRARCDNETTPTQLFSNVIFVRWKNASNQVISTTYVRTCRGALGTLTAWKNDVAILMPPAGAVTAELQVGGEGRVSPHLQSIGLFRFVLRRNGGGNMAQVLGELSVPNTRSVYQHTRVPNGALGWPGFFVGERIENISGIPGQPKGWTFTAPGGAWGDAGTWLADPVIGTRQANSVLPTNGATLAALENNVNTLITNLTNAKVVG